jgi:hypothetical protein
MKRKILLLIIPALVITNLLHAQIKKGSLLLGGQVGFSTTKSKTENSGNDRTQTGLNVSPAAGKAIKDNLVLGFDAVYTHNRDKTDNVTYSGAKANSYGAGVFLRKYIPLIDRLYLFGQGRLGASYSQTSNNSSPGSYYDTKGLSIGIGFYPGVSFAVSKKVHLESGFNNLAYVNFNHAKTEESTMVTHSINKSNSFSMGSSLENQTGFTVGVRVLLAK